MDCACGNSFTVEHVLSCPRGGFPTIRHNEIRDVTASLLTEVCHDVMIEPNLQPLTGEALTGATSNTADGARLDIAVNGFWGGRFERTFLDVRIFNPHAPTNKNTTISKCYRKHEAEKKRAYEQRILEVEQSTFTPLIFSATAMVEWPNSAQPFTRGWLPSLLTNGNTPTAQPSPGSDASSHSPS